MLLGAGHTHLHVVRQWRYSPLPGVQLICVSDFPVATYSGMLPGVLAGQYADREIEIDLHLLCRASSVELVVSRAVGFSRESRELIFDDRPPLRFDVLSIGIGSLAAGLGAEADETVVPIKPMQTFLSRLDERLGLQGRHLRGGPLRLAVVGGGAAGFEIAMCLPPRVAAVLNNVPIELTLIDAHAELLRSEAPRTRETAHACLRGQGVDLMLGRRVQRVADGWLEFEDDDRLAVDTVVWAGGAAPPPLLMDSELDADEGGFLLTRPTLQTLADDQIFAVGDAATIRDTPSPKAGVYAVRQGPVLWRNLRRLNRGAALRRFSPQQRFLKLLNTGDGRAIGQYGEWAWHSRWCWRLKDHIDRGFLARYQMG